jgi:hypothetical protein
MAAAMVMGSASKSTSFACRDTVGSPAIPLQQQPFSFPFGTFRGHFVFPEAIAGRLAAAIATTRTIAETRRPQQALPRAMLSGLAGETMAIDAHNRCAMQMW